MPDRVGQELGGYRLIRLLGKGSFAEVYLGEHLHLGTHAAIKVLKIDLAEQQHIDQFRKEARTIAGLVHPHIVRVLNFGIETGTPFLVMDYAPNRSLRERHPRGERLSLSAIVPYVKQIASALHYAHHQRVIHRDIKPENLLLGQDETVLISDFGIAVVLQQSRSYQTVQDIGGTPDYMAPEQFEGHARPASDQYALATIVYEWLAGDLPFPIGDIRALGIQKMQQDPPPIFYKVSKTPIHLEQILQRALAKDPRVRFPTVQAFAEALEQAEQNTRINNATTIIRTGGDSTPLAGSHNSDITLPQEPSIGKLPLIRGARADEILAQARKQKRQPNWHVYRANSQMRYLFFAIPALLLVMAIIVLIIASFFNLSTIGGISTAVIMLSIIGMVVIFVTQEELGHYDWLVLTPEGCIILRDSIPETIDYGTITSISYRSTGKAWWRLTQQRDYKLVIDDAYARTQREIHIDQHFASAKLIVEEIVVAHQEAINRARNR